MPTVFIVDNDETVRIALLRLIESEGLRAEGFADAEAFLRAFTPGRPGCLLLDMVLPGMSGLELQEKLRADNPRIPVVIMSACADVATAVRAMKGGACDFIAIPYEPEALLRAVRKALDLDADRRCKDADKNTISARLAALTARERQVVDLLVAGKTAKQAALILGLSVKTVSSYRARIKAKLGVNSMIDLLRVAQHLDASSSCLDLRSAVLSAASVRRDDPPSQTQHASRPRTETYRLPRVSRRVSGL